MSNIEGVQLITAAGSVTISNGVKIVYVNPASLLATLVPTFPANANDLDELWFHYGGTILTGVAVVTAQTLTPNSGQSIVGTLLTAPLGGSCTAFRYRGANTTWYKIV
ncbi:MAG TPA: hypothetical protein VGZ90_13240 [Puia sp.]|jgi:hypothetical protein|nr:hypothetical protein [Puia sp.]